jgi:PEGA domain
MKLLRNHRPWLLSLALCFAFGSARAEPPSDVARREAAQRFDRGLKLFNEQDNAGALAEFRRANELSPNAFVLYNIGLVEAAIGRPVEAFDALEQALRPGSGLKPELRSRAQSVVAEQSARIGRVRVVTRPEGARVEVDGVVAGRSPLAEPLRVASGTHVLGAVLEQYAPARKEVSVAGNQEIAVELELVATAGVSLAHLMLRSNVEEAVVRVDGQVVAKTPLVASLALVSGRHSVEVSRPGYVAATQQLELGPGATGELSFRLEFDPIAVQSRGATLLLDVTEPDPKVVVDGTRLGPYLGPLRLPAGPHALRVERDGFVPADRQIRLEATRPNHQRIRLEPTAATRSAYESSRSAHRVWGFASLAGSAILAGGSGVFLAVNASNKRDKQAQLDLVYDQATHEVICNVGSGDDAEICNTRYQAAKKSRDDTKARDAYGFVGLGIGAALAVTGVVLLLTAEPSDRFERTAHAFEISVAKGGAIAHLSRSF